MEINTLNGFRSKRVRRFDIHRQRAAANARERDRTESVNYAFNLLRALIPTEPIDRKLSKIETLRLASSYISHLNNVKNALSNGDDPRNICVRYSKIGSFVTNKICTFCLTNNNNNNRIESNLTPFVKENPSKEVSCFAAENINNYGSNICQLFPQLNGLNDTTNPMSENDSLFNYFTISAQISDF